MRKKAAVILWTVCIFVATCCALGKNTNEPSSAIITDLTAPAELVRHEQKFSSAYLEPARMGGEPGVAVIFDGTDDLHYYAKAEIVHAAGFELKVEAKSDDFRFGQALFPKWQIFTDPIGSKVEVYAGHFTVFVPMKAETDTAPTKTAAIDQTNVKVKISGIACTSMVCLPPFEKTLQARFDWSRRNSWKEISIETPGDADELIETVEGPGYSTWFALGLALLAGLILNIMPCIWPVLPLIVMRIVEQAKASRRQSVAMGFAFCLGILLFFACLAAANIILRVFYETALQWGDPFRYPTFVAVIALLLVVLALFMFGVFTIAVPSSIASKSGSGKGYTGALGIGFLAAILSTPCSFGILAAVFIWAQAQSLLLATVAIMVIGVGMAVPYAILTSLPRLLQRLPKAGRWMELLKQAIGFVLLVIAVKLIAALPESRRIGVLYFAVVLAFSVWMWAGWVGYGARLSRKWLIRIMAIILAVTAGWAFLPAPAAELIGWQPYDGELIDTALIQQRPVLIKFTADWCWNCNVVDKVVYRRKDIAKLIEQKGVLAVKADTTQKDNPASIDFQNLYNELSLPVSMLFLPGQEEPVRWRGKLFFADELKTLLESI